MQKPEIIFFDIKGDNEGSLIALESNRNVPFEIKRTYYIYGTAEGVTRGHHAHRALKQLLICVNGSVEIYCEYGEKKEIFLLDTPNKGLIIEGLIWHKMMNFSPNTVLLVLADDYYDESDYVRNYDEFLKLNRSLWCNKI